MADNKPIYKHDCSECIYLGTFTPSDNKYQEIREYDLYVHLKNEIILSLIARYSDHPGDYMCGIGILGNPEEENPCLQIPIFKEIFNRYNEKITSKN